MQTSSIIIIIIIITSEIYIWIKKEEKNVYRNSGRNLFINLPIKVRNNDEPRYLLFRFFPSFLNRV